jgi:hypothetical protein
MAIGHNTPNAEFVLGYERRDQGSWNEGLASEDQAPVVPAADPLFLVRHRQTGFAKRTIASGKFCTANSIALNRVFSERSSISRGDQTLRRQNAGGRAARYSSFSDKFGNCRFWVVLSGGPSCNDLNLGSPM